MGIKHGIIDNRERGTVAAFLEDRIERGSNVAIVSAYFTIHAYAALREKFERVDKLRLLFGEPSFLSQVNPDTDTGKAFQFSEAGLALGNQLLQKELAAACAEWIRTKVEVRSIKEAGLLHGKLYHIDNGQRQHALLGSSNLTSRGIGAAKLPNIELNIVVDSDRDRAELIDWFEEIWSDDVLVQDVKPEILRLLEQVYIDHPAEFIYFKTLFHVFEDYLAGRNADEALFEASAITDTQIWQALFDFQRDGAKGAINKVQTHNGCILADSVGLGKTYTALAVIKYFELRNERVLVLCPKKLRDNWTVFLAQNNSDLNPFVRDRFHYTVLSHTDLSRSQGRVDGIDLSTLNWGAYDLVVIDESHNFRNDTKGRRDADGAVITRSRYERLMDEIIRAGAKTKVLLLSATPVNNDLSDLRNQLYIATEGQDGAFSLSLGIGSIKETLSTAQKVFMEWARRGGAREPAALMEKLPSAFFRLLDELTIARSRRHIQKFYKETIDQIGQFPTRSRPASLTPDIDLKGRFPSYDRIHAEIDEFQLSLYNPWKYVREECRHLYEHERVRNFSQGSRERFLIGMMKVNFLKRLESSVRSFAQTMTRTVEKIEQLEAKLVEFKIRADNGSSIEIDLDPIDTELDEELAALDQVGGKLKYKLAHIEIDNWLADLAADRNQLGGLADNANSVDAARDAKLYELKGLIRDKVGQPTTTLDGEANRKVIVFCAFADTAMYLYEALEYWALRELGVHIALVSGGARPNRTTFGRGDFGQILANFSPRSKKRAQMRGMPQDGEIDILIATDCISEGQNLQDCDYLVNYDIHWNPVRLIQRFGRIDRIGSRNRAVKLVNFWPTPDLNKYINLKNRVEARMALVDVAATAEDNVLDAQNLEDLIKDDLSYRDKQLLRLKDEVLDLEDFDETVSLGEFTLDDFRLELMTYIEANKQKLAEAPLGLYAVVPPIAGSAIVRPGAVYCLRQKLDQPRKRKTRRVNPLEPYYLVYIRDSGEVRFNFTNAKQILEMLRAVSLGQNTIHSMLCAAFDQETEQGTDMTRFSGLVESCVLAINRLLERRGVDTMLSGRGGKLLDRMEQPASVDDFELISWFVIKEQDLVHAG